MIINSILTNDKVLLLMISFCVNWSDVRSDTILPIACDINRQKNSCFYPISRCNKKLGLCQCKPGYAIGLLSLGSCVDSRELGQICVHSSQCSQTANAVCLNANSIELNRIELIDEQLLFEYYTKIRILSKYIQRLSGQRTGNGYKSLGECKCKFGFESTTAYQCQRIGVTHLRCTGSHQCLKADLNSHCDAKSNHCFCDSGYFYDSDQNKCHISSKRFGDLCDLSFECQVWDPNMECRYSLCVCQKAFDFDLNTKRCKQMASKSKPCGYGFRWNENSADCELYHMNAGAGQAEYRFFSADKFLETIVIIIFCGFTFAILRFWRNILPQHIYNDSRTGMFAEFAHTNRVSQRRRHSRNNSLSNRGGRVIQLRVDLNSPDSESQYLPESAFVDLPLNASHSSLPPYESAGSSNPDINNQPPPYTDEPPTYEEAMALSQKIDNNLS